MGRFIQPDGICTAWKAALPGFGARQRQKDFCLCLAIRWSYPAVFPTRKNWRHFVPSPAQKSCAVEVKRWRAAAKWLGWPIQIRQILSAAGTLRPSVIPPGFCEPSPREVYPLLQAVFGLPKEDFAPWYCEISHKLRHRQGALLGVRAAGKIAATAGIYHQNRKAALIGSVATDPAFRRRGYASALVFSLADRARQKGRIPFVICQNPEAAQVYEQIGFTLWGEEWLCCRDKTAG